MSSINYPVVIVVVAASIIFILWMVRRNMKDEKKFEKDVIQSDIPPEKHNNDKASI